MINDIIVYGDMQDVVFLSDKNSKGKERPWKEKKMRNVLLHDSYLRLSDAQKDAYWSDYYGRRAERAASCACWLKFDSETKKLVKACFCQLSLCPMCAWRRERKIRSQLSKVVNQAHGEGYRFLFLTLTVENMGADDLAAAVDGMNLAFNKLFKYKRVDRAVKGYFRALEISHDVSRRITKKMYDKNKGRKNAMSKRYAKLGLKVGDLNPNYRLYHPHFHVLLAVKSSYFKGDGNYMDKLDWAVLWRKALRANYTPSVDVAAIKPKKPKIKDSLEVIADFPKETTSKEKAMAMSAAIMETAKYTVKDTDYIVDWDIKLTDETVKALDIALHHRRLIGYGGRLRDIHKELNLDAKVTADVHTDEGDDVGSLGSQILNCYGWSVGFDDYVFRRREMRE